MTLWEDFLKECEPYETQLKQWRETSQETSRHEIYLKIDGYPISNIAKMHIASNLLLIGAVRRLRQGSLANAEEQVVRV